MLWEHNLEIDWTTEEVSMSRCPRRCATCAEEARTERHTAVRERAAIRACWAGHIPFANLNLLDLLPLVFPHREALYEDNRHGSGEATMEDGREGEFLLAPDPELPDKAIEVGDRIYAMALHPPPLAEEIRASQTTSQRLAQAFATNTSPRPFQDTVPGHLHNFEDVFSKASFDSLPERKQWDHAIELLPDLKPANCKVYPLAPKEQDELDAFLWENLDVRFR